jgi:hypothetical protein
MLKRLLDHLDVIHVFSGLGYVLPGYVSRIIPAAFFSSPQNKTAKRLKRVFRRFGLDNITFCLSVFITNGIPPHSFPPWPGWKIAALPDAVPVPLSSPPILKE